MGVPDWSSILQLGADYGLISSFSQLDVLGFQVSAQETEGLVSIAGDPVNMGLPWKVMGNVYSEIPGTRDDLQCLVVQRVGCGEGDRDLVTRITWHFPGLNSIFQFTSQSCRMSRSSGSCRESARLLMAKYAAVSSAKSLTWLLTFSGRSFMYAKKRICPRTDPWGTPDVTGTSSEQSPSRTAVCDLPLRNDLVKSLAEVQQYNVCLLTILEVLVQFLYEHCELCFTWPLGTKAMLEVTKDLISVQMFHWIGCNNMLH